MGGIVATTPEMCSGSEAGSYLRLIDSCITQLKAQGPSRTCNESKEEEEDRRDNPRGVNGGLIFRDTTYYYVPLYSGELENITLLYIIIYYYIGVQSECIIMYPGLVTFSPSTVPLHVRRHLGG